MNTGATGPTGVTGPSYLYTSTLPSTLYSDYNIVPSVDLVYSLGYSGSDNNYLRWKDIHCYNVYAKQGIYATKIQLTSDYRIKENIKVLDNNFHVDYLNPITYINKTTNKQDVGLIAHELQEYYPELVSGVKDGPEIQTINYIGLIPILIKEIKDLKNKFLNLENKNTQLEYKNIQLESEIYNIKKYFQK